MEPTALAAVTTIWNSPEWMKEKRKTQASSSTESRYGWTFEQLAPRVYGPSVLITTSPVCWFVAVMLMKGHTIDGAMRFPYRSRGDSDSSTSSPTRTCDSTATTLCGNDSDADRTTVPSSGSGGVQGVPASVSCRPSLSLNAFSGSSVWRKANCTKSPKGVLKTGTLAEVVLDSAVSARSSMLLWVTRAGKENSRLPKRSVFFAQTNSVSVVRPPTSPSPQKRSCEAREEACTTRRTSARKRTLWTTRLTRYSPATGVIGVTRRELAVREEMAKAEGGRSSAEAKAECAETSAGESSNPSGMVSTKDADSRLGMSRTRWTACALEGSVLGVRRWRWGYRRMEE